MSTAVAQGVRIDPDPKLLKLRELLIYLFMVALLILVGFATHILFRYSIPQPNLVVLGKLADFPVSAEPYHFVNEKADVYIVNTENKVLALAPKAPNSWQCDVHWVAENKRFEDPCLGSKFALTGAYLPGPAVRGLDRYAVQLTSKNQIQIDLSYVIIESKAEWFNDCVTFYLSDKPVPPLSSSGRWSSEEDAPLVERQAECSRSAEQRVRFFRDE